MYANTRVTPIALVGVAVLLAACALMPRPMPAPTPPWSPMDTGQQAGNTLGSILHAFTELIILFALAAVPLLAPPILVTWGIWRWVGRRHGRQTL